jgi:hypothetical protein
MFVRFVLGTVVALGLLVLGLIAKIIMTKR